MVDRLLGLAGVESVDDAAVRGFQAQGVVGGQVGIADSEDFVKILNLTENISIFNQLYTDLPKTVGWKTE